MLNLSFREKSLKMNLSICEALVGSKEAEGIGC